MINKLKRFFAALNSFFSPADCINARALTYPTGKQIDASYSGNGSAEAADRHNASEPIYGHATKDSVLVNGSNDRAVTVNTILGEQKEFSRLIDPSFAYKELTGVGPKAKKKKKTKKQTAELNAEIMIETLKRSSPFCLFATRLQKESQIRRDRFLPLLKKLVKNGKITRMGSGKRGNPYRYGLPEN